MALLVQSPSIAQFATVVPVALQAILTPEEHLQRYLVTRQLLNDFRFRFRLGWTLDGGGRTSLVPSADPASSADPALLMRLAALLERLDRHQDGQLSLAELAEGMGRAEAIQRRPCPGCWPPWI